MLDILKNSFNYEFTNEEFLQAPENYYLVQSKAFKAWVNRATQNNTSKGVKETGVRFTFRDPVTAWEL